jgi:hypothetical protein
VQNHILDEFSEVLEKSAKKKTEKHVSFCEEKDRQSNISREVEENLDHSVVAKKVGILKIRSPPHNSPFVEDLDHQLPNTTKQTKILSKENLTSSVNTAATHIETGNAQV